MEKDFFAIQSDGIPIVGRVLTPDSGSLYPLVVLCHGAAVNVAEYVFQQDFYRIRHQC